jgi:N-acetylneuraminate synthase
MSTVRIGEREVGDDQRCFVIAEIGINHNGDIDQAKRLISVAVAAGCDAVKFQKRTVSVV